MIKQKKLWDNILTVIMALLCLLWIYPIVLILLNSLKKEGTFTTSTVFPDGGDKALAQADGNAADHCTRDGADAAQNGGNKGFQAQHGAHGGGSLRVGAAVQHRADTGQRGAHRKGKGDGAVDIAVHSIVLKC